MARTAKMQDSAEIDLSDGEPENAVQEVAAEPTDLAGQVEDAEEYDSTKMDPEEELWEGGPNFQQINEWKEKYGDIYVTTVAPDKHYVWRTLTRFEYRRLVKNLEQAVSTGQVSQSEANMNNEEQIAEICILYPPYERASTANELAGVASTLAQQVMEASAFTPVEVRQL